jgi:N6-L-threonylcarbamoyladenine synthase
MRVLDALSSHICALKKGKGKTTWMPWRGGPNGSGEGAEAENRKSGAFDGKHDTHHHRAASSSPWNTAWSMLHGLRHLKRTSPRARYGCILLTRRRHLLTLAIETSCDDTCVAILEKHDGLTYSSSGTPAAKLHFNEKITAANKQYGGIHPMVALESHHRSLGQLVNRSLSALPNASSQTPGAKTLSLSNGTLKRKPDFVSVTRGPGMRSNLVCGLDTAKGLSAAWQIPMVGVHHMQAHALTPRLVHALSYPASDSFDESPAFPFFTLLVSGGHTMLLHSSSLTTHTTLATTLDIAIGDALDKAGRVILPPAILASAPDTSYAKYLSNYAFPTPETYHTYPIPQSRHEEINKPLNAFGWTIRQPLVDTRDLAFSFGGIASRAETLASKPNLSDDERLLLARTTIGVAFEHLACRTVLAFSSLPNSVSVNTLVVSGGVASNPFLRYYLSAVLQARGYEAVELIFPPVELCTDNAAMIAWAGIEMYEAGYRTDLGVLPVKTWSMDEQSGDGGILGVGGWYRDDTESV